MKVFISWSGDRSRKVAELLKIWIKCVIQSVQPWVSSQDISRGELWNNAIHKQFAEITTGIICLTKDAKDKPWILFEAGALAKGLETSRIITFLIDLKSEDLLLSPLSAFNHTLPDKEGIRKMLSTINALTELPVDEVTFDAVFEKFWPDFDRQFEQIIKGSAMASTAPASTEDSQSDLLKELIKSVRNLEINFYQIVENNETIRHEIDALGSLIRRQRRKESIEPKLPVNEDMLEMLAKKFKKG